MRQRRFFNKKKFEEDTYYDGLDLDCSENPNSWSDNITEAWLRGQDITGDKWWYEIERKYDVNGNAVCDAEDED